MLGTEGLVSNKIVHKIAPDDELGRARPE